MECVSSCTNSEFITVGSTSQCASCAAVSNSIYVLVNLTLHQCSNCSGIGMYVHSNNVCNSTNCSIETSSIFDNNGDCWANCNGQFVDTTSSLTCVSSCNYYINATITNNSLNIVQAMCYASCPSGYL